jgi:hypothetical protein
MSQPPYPPPDGAERPEEHPGQEGAPEHSGPAADRPTEQLGQPDAGGRDATQQFPQPFGPPSEQRGQPYGQPAPYGQYGPPGQQYGPPAQPYGEQPGPYGPPGPSGQPGDPGQYPPPGQYGPGQYGQPQYPGQYGPGQYGQGQYGQPPYGQAGQWGQPPYGPPGGYGPGGPGGRAPRNRGTVIALVVAGVVVLAGVAVALILLLGRHGSTTTASSTASATTASTSSSAGKSSSRPSSTRSSAPRSGNGRVPPATKQPTGLGNDSDLNQYAQECYSGEMDSCDFLYLEADVGSPYERYGDTCAGRQPENTSRLCSESFPG